MFALVVPRGAAVELDEVRTLFINGDYKKCIRLCNDAIADSENSEEWRLLLARSMMAIGQYTNAISVVSTVLAVDSADSPDSSAVLPRA